MAEDVKRYSLRLGDLDDEMSMHDDPQGHYVGYQDFSRLESRYRSLSAKLWWQVTGHGLYVLYRGAGNFHRTRSRDGGFRSASYTSTTSAIDAAERNYEKELAKALAVVSDESLKGESDVKRTGQGTSATTTGDTKTRNNGSGPGETGALDIGAGRVVGGAQGAGEGTSGN